LDINLTLVVQMLVFVTFVWFTLKFVWPPLVKALEERQEKIADGLAAAERGRRELELAQHRIKDEMKHAKVQASEVVEKANRRAAQIIEEAKHDARQEAQQLAKIANEHISQEVNRAKDTLRKQVATLAVVSAEKILMREIDAKTNHSLMDNLIEEI
jgi:F-type H+-transporting ATPase subunit b